LSSDIDCLCGRFIVVYMVGRRDGLSVEVQGYGMVDGGEGCEGKVQKDFPILGGRQAEPEALTETEWRRDGAVVDR